MDDAAHRRPPTCVIDRGGPDLRTVDLPVSLIMARLRRRGIPVRPSRDAGDYVCNAVLYEGLVMAPSFNCRLGFVHIPAELAAPFRRQNGVQRTSPLSWEQALMGGLEIMAGCLGRAVPWRVPRLTA